MAKAFRIAGGGRLNIEAVQHLVEQHAVDAAPDLAPPIAVIQEAWIGGVSTRGVDDLVGLQRLSAGGRRIRTLGPP